MSMTSGDFQPPHSLGRAIEKLRSRWPWFVGYGVLCAGFGVLALTMVAASTLAVVFFVALMLIVAGGAEIILGFNSRDWPSFFLWVISGLFYLAVGAFSLARPEVAAAVLTVFIGVGFLLAGVARIWLGFRLPTATGPRVYVVMAGVVTTCLGVFILSIAPSDPLLVLGTLFGVDLLFYGASWIALGLKLRS
jgi:uncharacterized membrane protein HdeD (DUF308 family)